MSWNLLKKRIVITIAMFLFISTTFAVEKEPMTSISVFNKIVDTGTAIEKISAKMNALQIPVNAVNPFVVDGLYEVLTERGVFYVSNNGQYLFSGDVIDLNNEVNLSTQRKKQLVKDKILPNLSKLDAFEKDMIIYKAPQEKHVITIFTDISCTYCQKLHEAMQDYHKQGITVRYLAFPRGGVNTSTYRSMASVWCADDPKLAMDDAMAHRKIPVKTCGDTVKEQYELGLLYGVNGTPAILLQDGTLVPGYVPADQLINMLEKK